MLAPLHRNRILLTSTLLAAAAIFALVALRDRSGHGLRPMQTVGSVRNLQGSSNLDLEAAAPFPGLLALDSIQLHTGAVIDAWDSPIEGFLQGHTLDSGKAQVRSLGSIDLEFEANSSPTVIVGHATSASAPQTRIQKGGFVTGSIAPSTTLITLPNIPASTKNTTADFSLATGKIPTQVDQLSFDQVRIHGDASWILRGPLRLQLSELEIEDQATLIVDASQGPVIVHIEQRFSMGLHTRLSCQPGALGQVLFLVGQGRVSLPELVPHELEQDRIEAMRARLSGKRAPEHEAVSSKPLFDLQCSGEFHGLLYAPFSHVTMPSGLRFHGVLTAESIELESGAHVTCDPRALGAWQFQALAPDNVLLK